MSGGGDEALTRVGDRDSLQRVGCRCSLRAAGRQLYGRRAEFEVSTTAMCGSRHWATSPRSQHPATSRPSRRARKPCLSAPAKGRFPAASSNLALARPGHKRALPTAGSAAGQSALIAPSVQPDRNRRTGRGWQRQSSQQRKPERSLAHGKAKQAGAAVQENQRHTHMTQVPRHGCPLPPIDADGQTTRIGSASYFLRSPPALPSCHAKIRSAYKQSPAKSARTLGSIQQFFGQRRVALLEPWLTCVGAHHWGRDRFCPTASSG